MYRQIPTVTPRNPAIRIQPKRSPSIAEDSRATNTGMEPTITAPAAEAGANLIPVELASRNGRPAPHAVIALRARPARCSPSPLRKTKGARTMPAVR
jgi:hypothetical protein